MGSSTKTGSVEGSCWLSDASSTTFAVDNGRSQSMFVNNKKQDKLWADLQIGSYVIVCACQQQMHRLRLLTMVYLPIYLLWTSDFIWIFVFFLLLLLKVFRNGHKTPKHQNTRDSFAKFGTFGLGAPIAGLCKKGTIPTTVCTYIHILLYTMECPP